MEWRDMGRWGWLNTATRGIRFRPDREAVWAELFDHFEDKIADLMRIYPDLSRREAEKMAVARMGDPEQIGKELAKFHKPWLGYLWRVSQVLLAVLAVLVAAVCLKEGGMDDKLRSVWDTWNETQQGKVIARVIYENGTAAELTGKTGYRWDGLERLALYDLDREARLGEATLTLSRAALWRTETGQDLYLRVRIDYDRVGDKNEYLLPWYLQGEDSLGNHYGYELNVTDTGASIQGLRSSGEETGRKSITWNFCLEDLPEEAEWLRLSYALRPNVDLGFFVDLREEGTP